MPIRVALKAGPKVGEKTRPRKGRQGITEKSPKMGPKSKTKRPEMMGGGLMAATERLKRQGLKKGGGACKRGMGRAYGKNS